MAQQIGSRSSGLSTGLWAGLRHSNRKRIKYGETTYYWGAFGLQRSTLQVEKDESRQATTSVLAAWQTKTYGVWAWKKHSDSGVQVGVLTAEPGEAASRVDIKVRDEDGK